jgi:sulfite reductase (ferredoxin)
MAASPDPTSDPSTPRPAAGDRAAARPSGASGGGTAPGAAPARGRKPGRHRGEGQWAMGHYTPLNANEQVKKDDDGLNVRTRIETIYAHRGFDSIDPADLRGRMRWWGLYTQRKPGIDGGRTAVLEPHELDDEHFMLRVRIDGGRLTVAQLRTIGEISQEFARGTADITDRQNIQLHWIRIEDVPEIWRRLEAVGLSTTEACGDTPRVIIGSPVAGIAEDEIIDGTPAVEEISRRFIGSKEFSNLPRKFKTAVSGSPLLDVAHEINDVAFVGVRHPELGPGFDLWVGGGLSTNPKLGVRLGAWVPLEDVPQVWAGVVGIFRDYGYRRLRNRARLKFLVADWGAARFREVLETEYLMRTLADGPAPEQPAELWRDHVGVHRQRDGRYYVGFAPRVGRVDGTTLTKIAELAAAHGSDRLRTTVEQKMLVLDIEQDKVESLVAGLEALGLKVNPSPFRRGTMACTGIEFCKLAIVETKGRGQSLIEELERRLPDFDEPLTININGCPNACARIQVADIGLKGQLVTDANGEQVEGYQVHLGGALGLDPGFGRKVRGLKVTAAELPDYVERLLRRYRAGRQDGERFAQWAARAPEEALS